MDRKPQKLARFCGFWPSNQRRGALRIAFDQLFSILALQNIALMLWSFREYERVFPTLETPPVRVHPPAKRAQ